MPAVQLARLKTQIHALIWRFTRPHEFLESLLDLLEYYAEQGYRPGEKLLSSKRTPASFRVPALVLRQLEQQLTPVCRENPDATFPLIDVLWKDRRLEPRLLAAYLMGRVPLHDPEPVLKRLKAWCQPSVERPVLTTMLTQGCLSLRRQHFQHWLELIQTWANNPDPAFQAIALQAILPAISDREFENLPPIFHLITPLYNTTSLAVQSYLREVTESLTRRSPTETAYLIQNILSVNPTTEAIRLVRRALPAFNLELQDKLRKIITTLTPPSPPKRDAPDS